MKTKCGTVEKIKTSHVDMKDTLKGPYWLKSRGKEGFRSLMSCVNARAISTIWFAWQILGLIISSFALLLKESLLRLLSRWCQIVGLLTEGLAWLSIQKDP